MHPVSFLFFGTVVIVVALTAAAMLVSPRFVWPAAIVSHFLSFLGSWSIGLFTLILPFALVATGIAHATGWLTSFRRGALAVAAGVAVWAIAIVTVDDAWLFLPWSLAALLFS